MYLIPKPNDIALYTAPLLRYAFACPMRSVRVKRTCYNTLSTLYITYQNKATVPPIHTTVP